jgi:FkbM family methyltransferase
LKEQIRRLIDMTARRNLAPILSPFLTIHASVYDRRRTRVRWDGEDWEYRWADGEIFYSSYPTSHPAVVTKHEQLFFAEYTPSQGDIVVDVGAGGGTEIIRLSKALGPSGRVIAIEADPVALRRLRKQVAALGSTNVEILPIAVSELEGTIDLYFSQEGHVGNSTTANTGECRVAVEARPLRDILADLGVTRVSYMKVNIEGAEYAALKSLGDSIRNVENLCISCHDFTGIPEQRTYDDVHRYLTASNFKPFSMPANPGAPWEDYYIFARQN